MTDPYVYSAPVGGCLICKSPQTSTVDGYGGRRCQAHPTVFDPAHAVALMVGGQPGTAAAYVRWSA